MAAPTQHLMNLTRRTLCAAALLTLAPLCHAQDVQLPAQTTTWSSGTNTISATNSITASGPANAPLTINGTAQITFIAGAQINLEPGFTATADPANTGTTFHALITPPVPITFQSNPSGCSIQVDGAAYTTPVTIQFLPGTHIVDASIAQSAPSGTRYNFLSWSDNGTAAHTVIVSTAATLAANFTTQYYLTTAASPPAGGTVVPPSGWYNPGAAVAIGVTPNNGYLFSGFSGSLSGATTPQSLTMTAPASVTAAFLPDFTISTATGMATVPAGSTSPIAVNVTGPAGSPMTVAFDAPGLPAGFTASFSPASLTFTGSGSTTMSVTAAAGSGGYRIVSARGAVVSGPSHSTGINLAVQDFIVTPSPATLPTTRM
jgi:hypothetical protein